MFAWILSIAFALYLVGTWVWDKVTHVTSQIVKIRVFAGEHQVDMSFESEEAMKLWLKEKRAIYDFYERRN